MSRHARRFLALVIVLPVVAFCFGSTTEASDKTARKYQKLYSKTYEKAEEKRWDDVLRLATKMEKVAPEATLHEGFLAQAHAQLGNRDDAYAALERMIEPGWTHDKGFELLESLTPLYGDERFEALSRRAAEMGRAWQEWRRTMHVRLPPSEAEVFDSADALTSAFETRRNETQWNSMLIAGPRYLQRLSSLNDREIAAAWRYVDDHPGAEDLDDAGVAAVRAANRYKEYSPFLDGDAAIVLDTADRFLERWPDSEHRPEVELTRAIATWKAHGKDEGDATRVRRSEEALPLFAALEERFGDSPEATKARIWRFGIAMELGDAVVTPEIEDLYGRIEPAFEDDRELEQYAWREAARAMFQINGKKLFDGVDLDGNSWTWETMRGKVVLIDFWATWCGPCVDEIPQIKETHDKYREAGFAVVGVSLDGGDKNAFLKECEDLGIDWPQIFDGKGWNTALARSFGIWGVPTPVLIDRDGRVVAVHGEARGDRLEEKVAELVEADGGGS